MNKQDVFTFEGVNFAVGVFGGEVLIVTNGVEDRFAINERIQQIKFVRKMVEEFGDVERVGLKATKDFVDSYYVMLGLSPCRPVAANKVTYIHELRGQGWSNHFAHVEERSNDNFLITDAWNCGSRTAGIIFPDLASARFFLAGKWSVPASTISLVASREIKPELTTDEKIVKHVRQYWRGIITIDDLLRQFYVLQDAEGV